MTVAIGPPLRLMRVSSPYGPRPPGAFHTGTDFVAPSGTPVYAAAAGQARRATNGGGGWGVVIDHGGGVTTEYWHLSSRVIAHFGQVVAAGQLIGLSGASGVVTGPHLHFEVKINGQYTDPMRAIGGIGNLTPARVCVRQGTTRGPLGIMEGPAIEKVAPNADGSCPAGYIGPYNDAPALLPDDNAIIGAAAGLAFDWVIPVAINAGVVVGAVLIGWGGVKKVIGG